MTWAEFAEIVAWAIPRWTLMARWSDDEWHAMYEDLSGYQAGDVRAAVERLWITGREERPPRGGSIRATLDAMGVPPPQIEAVCWHRWTHEPPSRASAAVTGGAGEQRCLGCGTVKECRCEECRADANYQAEEK